MKISGLILVAIIVVLIGSGWYLYQEYFIFTGEKEGLVLTELCQKADMIKKSAERLDIDARLLASIIYAEKRLNVTLVDSFEDLFAQLGHNSSIGLAQIRVNTAKWIIDNAKDSTSNYFIERQYHCWLPSYQSDEEVIRLLKQDSINCLLAAFHIRQIIQRWERAGFDISSRPDIIMTLYSYGLVNRATGEEIIPHARPKSNFLGEVAKRFYGSNKLSNEYAKLIHLK